MFTNCGQRSLFMRQRGISLIELIMFIVIISVALVGILLVMNQTVSHSADPLIRKQALAIAESLLEEVELMPFTYCDPMDANAASAVSVAGCATLPEIMGPETVSGFLETRYGPTQFNNVNDYGGFGMASINDITNGAVAGLAGYAASVTVANSSFDASIPASESLLITVTVTPPGGDAVVMQGYRTRYSPRI